MRLPWISIASMLLAIALSASAQPRAPRIAYVWLFDNGPSAPYIDSFRSRLAELGWVEGRNFHAEYRDAKGDQKVLAAIMDELVRTKVDLIVAMCTPEAVAAKKVTSTIPIVVAAVGDPVAAGLVKSLAKPGGNVTGVSAVLLPLSAKRVDLLKEAVPGVKRASVVWNPVRKDNEPEVKAMQESARRNGIEMQSYPVRSRDELRTALDFVESDGTQAILNSGDTLLSSEIRTIVDHAARRRIVGMYESRAFVDAGGLMSYGPNFPEMHRRAADYVDRILRGAKPGDLPIEEPTRFEFVINKKAVAALGLRIPPSVLLRADAVVE